MKCLIFVAAFAVAAFGMFQPFGNAASAQNVPCNPAVQTCG